MGNHHFDFCPDCFLYSRGSFHPVNGKCAAMGNTPLQHVIQLNQRKVSNTKKEFIMGEVQVFHYGLMNEVRATEMNGEPWFVAKDVCVYFGDSDHKRSISRLDDDEKMIIPVTDRMGRTQQATAVNESGLYTLLFNFQPEQARSKDGGAPIEAHIEERLKKIKAFKRWITHEVIPAIRKQGGYIASR